MEEFIMKRDLKKIISQMTLEEKAGMCSGLDFWHLKSVERLGIPEVMVSDGPHGLRKQDDKGDHLGMNDSIKAVCFPPAALSACSFDRSLMEAMGETIGREAQANDVSVVLGPAVNIKRSPLCGRNFEYYSEDPLLAGMMAAAMTLGVQKVPGCGTTIKHFACNNQEDNRMGSDSILSERALREIYLKGFEIAVKDAQPMSIMTSYNLINGVHAANCYDTCTKAARDEWGFAGAIMTDWTTTNVQIQGECTAAGCMRAGNDMVMPGMEEDHENIRKELKEGTLDIRELKRCIYNTVNIILQSNQYEEAVSYENQFDGLGEWMTVK